MEKYLISARTTDGQVWLDEDKWTTRDRATRYGTYESAKSMALWFLFDMRGRSPKLLGYSIEKVKK